MHDPGKADDSGDEARHALHCPRPVPLNVRHKVLIFLYHQTVRSGSISKRRDKTIDFGRVSLKLDPNFRPDWVDTGLRGNDATFSAKNSLGMRGGGDSRNCE